MNKRNNISFYIFSYWQYARRIMFLFFVICFSFFVADAQTKPYQVGDVITNSDGTKGVIFWIQPDGSGGWMVALNDVSTGCNWGPNNVDIPALPDVTGTTDVNSFLAALDDTDGYGNTQIIRAAGNAATYPAVYTMNFANGWYLPAAGQLTILFAALPIVSPIIINNGGTDLSTQQYWTSTEYSATTAWYCDFGNGWLGSQPMTGASQKNSNKSVRAVKSFGQSMPYDSTLTYLWNDPLATTTKNLTVSPIVTTKYTVSVSSSMGCPVSVSKTVIVNNATGATIKDTICQNTGYNKNGFSLPAQTTAGNFSFQLNATNSLGCDSLVTLNLTVNPTYNISIKDTISQNNAYTKHGFNLPVQTTIGTFTFPLSLVSSKGCDSLVTLSLTVNPVYNITIKDTICLNNAYTKHGFNLPIQTIAGIFNSQRTSIIPSGNDSIISLVLDVLPPIPTTFLKDTICQNQPYVANGFNIPAQTTSGTFNFQLSTTGTKGCDSIVVLNLTVKAISKRIINDNVCQNNPYNNYGFSITSSQTATTGTLNFQRTTLGKNGCDSVSILNLTVNPVYNKIINDKICINEAYNKNGFNLPTQTNVGTFTFHLSSQTTQGCDSLVTLNLTVNSISTTTFDDQICQNEYYNKNGFSLSAQTVAGLQTYTQTKTNALGCDSIITLNLNVLPLIPTEDSVIICNGSSYQFFDEILNATGTYTRYISTATTCEIHTLHLTVSENPQITDYIQFGSENNPQIEFVYSQGTAPYIFAINGTIFSSNGIFSNVPYGNDSVQITDANNCSGQYRFWLEANIYPADFFSPNGDGKNDRWTIGNIEYYPNVNIRIFDRYGKVLAEYKGYNNEQGWDGTYLGKPLKSDDYWYLISDIHMKKVITGHFTLIR